MKLEGKRILVTGAGGFIGSHLMENLVERGIDVKAFVRYNSRDDWGMLELLDKKIRKKLEVYSGDLKDSDAVRGAMEDRDVVFHLGALIAIPYSYQHPRETVETNIIGTLNVMTAARDMGIKRIVHTSTSEVFGTAKYVPINEEHPLQGQSPYSASKIGADKIAESFFLSYKLPVSTLRPFNTFGPRQSTRAVIPTIITQALRNKNIKLGSLEPTRDLMYVQDTVEGFIKMAETDKAVGETINIGTGSEISIGELAKKIIKKTNPKLKVIQESKRKRPTGSEVMRLCVDNKKAKKLLKWKPKYTLDKGLTETIGWFKKNLQYYEHEGYTV
jgi:NAD dependent epimerase/dehydratase